MTNINVYGAGARALAQRTNIPATCLATAWVAIGQGRPALRHAATAAVEWFNTPGKVKGKLPPAAGFPGYFAGPAGYGDVAVYLGNDQWAGIDSLNGKYHAGTINPQSTAQRAKQVGGAYLGYSKELLGYKLDYQVPVIPRVVIPAGVELHDGYSVEVGGYRFGVNKGATTVTVISTGHVHVAFKPGPANTWVVFQADGHFVGYYLDGKGKRRVLFASNTYRKAAGGTLELFATGALVIFDKKHRAVQSWG